MNSHDSIRIYRSSFDKVTKAMYRAKGKNFSEFIQSLKAEIETSTKSTPKIKILKDNSKDKCMPSLILSIRIPKKPGKKWSGLLYSNSYSGCYWRATEYASKPKKE